MFIFISLGINALVLILLVTLYGKLDELGQIVRERLPKPEKPQDGPDA
jgi:hypothetical protein